MYYGGREALIERGIRERKAGTGEKLDRPIPMDSSARAEINFSPSTGTHSSVGGRATTIRELIYNKKNWIGCRPLIKEEPHKVNAAISKSIQLRVHQTVKKC